MKITVKNDFRNLKKGDVYDFTDINKLKTITVVGKNGCGKSSIFQALRGTKDDIKNDSLYKNDFLKLKDNIEVEHSYEKIFYLDSVKDNGSDLNNAYDASAYVNSGGFYTKDKSHGESSLLYLSMFLDKIKKDIVENKTLIVFDEFDKGFSLELQAKVRDIIYNISEKHNVHIITISHNPILIYKSYIVYDMEKREMVSSSKYLNDKIGMTFIKE